MSVERRFLLSSWDHKGRRPWFFFDKEIRSWTATISTMIGCACLLVLTAVALLDLI